MDDDDEDAPPRKEPTLNRTLRIGLAAGLLGIAVGFFLALHRIEELAQVFQLGGYTPAALIPFTLGGAAITISIVEIVKTGRYRGPAIVFLSGVVAVAAPFIASIVVGVIVVAVIAAAFNG